MSSVHPVHLTNVEKHQAALLDQANRLEPWIHLQAAIIYTHHHHWVLLCQKADTCFTTTERTEGWVDLFDECYYGPRVKAKYTTYLITVLQ